jgi:hypothetical protein
MRCQTCYREVNPSYEMVYAAWDDSAMCGECYERAWPIPTDDAGVEVERKELE